MTTLPRTRQDRVAPTHGVRTATLGVAIHVMVGTLAGTVEMWREGKSGGTGAHIAVGLTECVQTADLDAICWHAPGDDVARAGQQLGNQQYIGIEHEGDVNGQDDSVLQWLRRRRQRALSAHRAAWILYHYKCGAPRWGYNVVPHHDFPQGGHPRCPGPHFPRRLYMLAVKRAYRKLVKTHGRLWK